jgi:hypothetical protein
VLRAEVEIDGCRRKGLVDTGSSYTLVSAKVAGDHVSGDSVWLETMGESRIRTSGSCRIRSLIIDGGKELGPCEVQVLKTLPMHMDIIVGLDVVLKHGLTVSASGEHIKVEVGGTERIQATETNQAGTQPALVCGGSDTTITVADDDHEVQFVKGQWIARWRWSETKPVLSCGKPNYSIPPADKEAFDSELESWVEDGILVPWNEATHGLVKNVIPLMSVHQVKGSVHKVRPVLDFSYLNKGVLCLSTSMPTCDESLRDWRTRGQEGAIVDLKKAYLQVHMAKDLWVYQAVRWRGRMYLLTRLGFGLNVAPTIMTTIVQKVLSMDPGIQRRSRNFIDDIVCLGES